MIAHTRSVGIGGFVPPSTRECRLAVAVSALLCAWAIVASLAGPIFGDIGSLLPMAAITWALCDWLTAFLLLVHFYVTGRAIYATIAAAFMVSAILTWAMVISAISIVHQNTQSLGDQQVAPFYFFLWHVLFASLILIGYATNWRVERIVLEKHRPLVVAVVATSVIAVTLLIAAAIYGFRDRLPLLSVNGVFQTQCWAYAVPLTLVVGSVACAIVMFSDAGRSRLSLWLAVALFSSILDGLLNVVWPAHPSYRWDAGNGITLATALIVLVVMLVQTIRVYVRSSHATETRTIRGAARMRALWQIATCDGLSEANHIQMIMETATAHVRSDRDVVGTLSHCVDGTIVVDAIASQGSSDRLDEVLKLYAAGSAFPMASDVHRFLFAGGKTGVWQESPELIDSRCSLGGFTSIIGTPIRTGSETHFLVFFLFDALRDEPFIESDVAFVDVVASTISHRFHQRSQLERLQFQIEHDSLTSLYNRTQFQRMSTSAAADGTLFGIILINLDGFRDINERFGQMIGDELLLEIAAALKHADEHDIVARLGGDDFAVLLHTTGDTETLAQRLQVYERAFHRPFHAGDRGGKVFVKVTASLGAARFVRSAMTVDEAMSNANVALDSAKTDGGNRGVAFGPQLEYAALQRSLERDEVSTALRNNEFELEYQPTVAMNSRAIVGAEALIRWRHPTRGYLPPAAFLEAIKRANLLGSLTAWVVQRIARDLTDVPLPHGIRCYVNVPAQVLESDSFIVNLRQTLERHPDLARQIGLEITESDVMNRVERAITTLEAVRTMGLRVSIDDFGTGYSSLSYLKRLPIDIVKLDKSFIDGLPDDRNDVALAEMFLALTKQFALVSVAEGIENEEQAAWLLANGCMIGQGYLFSKPVAFPRLCELIIESAARFETLVGMPLLL